MDLGIYCGGCRHLIRLAQPEPGERELACARCERRWGIDVPERLVQDGHIGPCVQCGESAFFRQKSFNRKLGMAVVLVSIALAPYTLYMSLFVGAAFDGVIYLLVPWVGICYNCEVEYRGYAGVAALDYFDHLTAQKVQVRQEKAAESSALDVTYSQHSGSAGGRASEGGADS